MPGHVYFDTYARLRAAVSTRLAYPRSERDGLGTQRERLLDQARGSTVELVGAFIGINLHAYPPDLDELVLLLRHPHMASRLRRELVASGCHAKIIEFPKVGSRSRMIASKRQSRRSPCAYHRTLHPSLTRSLVS